MNKNPKSLPALHTIIDALPAAIYLTDSEGRLTHYNKSAAEFSGYVPELGTDKWCVTWKLYHPDGTPMPHDHGPMALALKEGRRISGEEAIAERPDGKKVWFRAYPSPLYNSEGEITGGINMLIDITDRRKTEQALRENETRLSSKMSDLKRLYTLNTQLLRKHDVKAALQEVMKASAALMNADKASVQIYDKQNNVLKLVDTIGFDRHFYDQFRVIDPCGFTTCAAALTNRKQILLEDCSKTSEFTDFARITTSYGMNAVLSTPLFGSAGQIFGVFSMYWVHSHNPSKNKLQLLDLYTQQASRQIERRQAEEDLQTMNDSLEERIDERTEALLAYQDQLRSLAVRLSQTEEKERQRLAAELHDNLGQILAVGKMELDLIAKDHIPEHVTLGLAKVTEMMNEAIELTRELMSDLKPAPTLDQDDPVASIEWVAHKMKKYGLEVTIRDDDQSKPLTEDIRTALCQSVRELLFNIVKHAGVNRAEIILSRIGRQMQVIVRDEGKGFNSVNKKLEPTQKGGFGLFSLQERLGWLDSSMEINSRPNEGTEVKLLLPVDTREADYEIKPGEKSDAVALPVGNVSVTKVLIADDHQMMRKGLRKLIEEQDDLLVIGEASNGREAVELTYSLSPDIIIMDVNMPEMNGIEATRLIMEKSLPVRVIGLSFHESDDVAQSMLAAGASMYLSKSEVFETLCATVRSEGMILNGDSNLLSA